MAGSRSLGTLTVDLVAKIAGFEQGMNKAERELDKRAKRMNDVAKKIGAGIGAAITVGLAASAALATGLKMSIDRMDELSKAAQRASLPTEQFTQLAYAGDLADVSMEELTKSLGKETAKTGIRVNCITPAAVRTAIFDQMTPQHIEFMLSKIPMGRFGLVEEIAAMVAWLASEECSFTTGAVFDVSGGRAVY